MGYLCFVVRSRLRHASILQFVEARWKLTLLAPAGQLFGQLVDLLAFYTAFPIDNNTAQALSEQDVQQRHYDKVPYACISVALFMSVNQRINNILR